MDTKKIVKDVLSNGEKGKDRVVEPFAEVVRFPQKPKSSMDWKPEDLLKESLERLASGGDAEKVKKVVVLYLDDSDGGYKLAFNQCGMDFEECADLCQTAAERFEDGWE